MGTEARNKGKEVRISGGGGLGSVGDETWGGSGPREVKVVGMGEPSSLGVGFLLPALTT